MERMTIVSGDGHGGPAYETYREYLDPAYRDRLDLLAEEERLVLNGIGMSRKLNDRPDVIPLVDERGLLAAGKYLELYHDVHQRLAQMDAEGIAGDFVLAGSEYALPFFHELNDEHPVDVRAAGLRAYHRWLADFVGESGGRLFANGYALPTADIKEMLAELEAIAAKGFVSVEVPQFVADPSLPDIISDFYEPFWSACADLGLVLNVHAGWGKPQGEVIGMLGQLAMLAEASPDGMPDLMTLMGGGADADGDFTGDAMLLEMGPRQLIWQMMLGGVFDRYPSLKVALVELRADWLPATIAYLDDVFAKRSLKLKLKPSEYFAQNFGVTPSSPRPTEAALRHEIGIDHLMFGADMPHAEGTWPNTRTWLAHTFAGVPEDELRKILGENAIRFYNLDRRPLDAAAARIGPTAAEISGGADVPDLVLGHWHGRSGYLSPTADVDTNAIEHLLADDLTRAGKG